MAQPTGLHFDECLHLPRAAVRFPIELVTPPGFRIDEPATWPVLEGRLEVVKGKLLYMPPSADVQQDVCSAVTSVLFSWVKDHPDFVVGSNEAGMILGDEARAADAAVWRRADVEPRTGRFRRRPPILAVEVAGSEQGERELRDKARWYLDAGVEVVWLVLPDTREVVVITKSGDDRRKHGEVVPAIPTLDGLSAAVADFFVQLDR